VCRDCAAERNSCWRGLKRRWVRRTMTKRGVTEVKGRDVFGNETRKCRARQSGWSVRDGKRMIMAQRCRVVEHEIGFRQR
jgi:hypothetical protein